MVKFIALVLVQCLFAADKQDEVTGRPLTLFYTRHRDEGGELSKYNHVAQCSSGNVSRILFNRSI